MDRTTELKNYIKKRIEEEEGTMLPSSENIQEYIAEFMQVENARPIETYEGYSPTEIQAVLYNLFEKSCPVKIANFQDDVYEHIPLFRQVKLFLEILRKEEKIKLTKTGSLPVRIVKELYATGAPDEFITSGLFNLNREEDSFSVRLTRFITKLMRATKKRHNTLTLTKSGEKLLTDDRQLLFVLLNTFFIEYNPVELDYFNSPAIGNLGIGYTLILLDKYGEEEREDTFYADKYFKAFPKLLNTIDSSAIMIKSQLANSSYSLRVFNNLLYHIGVVEKRKTEGKLNKLIISRNELFTKLFCISPPKQPTQ